MDTCVYLTDSYIQILAGKDRGGILNVAGMYHIELEKPYSVGGVLLLDDELSDLISDIWDRYKLSKRNVTLVVSFGTGKRRIMTLPELHSKDTLEIISREFSSEDTETEEESYDYMRLKNSPDGKNRILAIGVKNSVIEPYISMFNMLGIRLSCITDELFGQIKIIKKLPEFNNKSCIILFYQANYISSMILDNGAYIYSSRNRLTDNCGAESFRDELIKSVNQIMQFITTRRVEHPIEDLCFFGFGREFTDDCKNAAAALYLHPIFMENDSFMCVNKNTVIEKPDEVGVHVGAWLNTSGSMLKNPGGRDINLLKSFKNSKIKKRREDIGKKLSWYIIPVSAFAICIVITCILRIYSLILKDDLTDALDNVDNDMISVLDQVDVQNSMLDADISQADEFTGILKSYPKAGSQVFKAIQSALTDADSYTIDSYALSDGEVSFTAFFDNVDAMHENIEKLYDFPLFENVVYDGYDYLSKKYKIVVKCIIKGGGSDG